MADEVGGDDGEAFGQRRHDESPGRRAPGHAVHQDDHRTGAGGAVANAMAVDIDVAKLDV